VTGVKQLVLGLALGMLLLLPVPLQAAEEPAFSWQDAVENIDLEVMEEYKNHIDAEINSYMETKPVKEWLGDFIKGDWVKQRMVRDGRKQCHCWENEF
jgi:hypothetical protein